MRKNKLEIVSSAHGEVYEMTLILTTGEKLDITSYPKYINEDELIVLDDTEYELELLYHEDEPEIDKYTYLYNLNEVEHFEPIRHDLTEYL